MDGSARDYEEKMTNGFKENNGYILPSRPSFSNTR